MCWRKRRSGMRPRAPHVLVGGVLALGGLRPGLLHAADIQTSPATDDRVAVIALSGDIMLADGNKFADAAARLGDQRVAVVFNSRGGALLAGLQIGQIIQLHHYATFVAQDALCASACALAWLSGAPRMMQDGAHIGFHAAYVHDGRAKVETGVGNALVGAYMTTLGLSVEAIVYAESAHPDDITWLTREDAQRLGIELKVVPSDSRPAEPAPAALPAVHPAAPRPRHDPSVLTPELAAPQPSAPAGTDPSEQARSFAQSYFAHWSESNGQAIAFFSHSYAATVTYYGRSVDHATLVQTKSGYADRWPVRVYTVQTPTLRVFCGADAGVCTVSGVVDWDCRSPAREATSKGSANFSLTVALAGERRQILAESGTVIASAN